MRVFARSGILQNGLVSRYVVKMHQKNKSNGLGNNYFVGLVVFYPAVGENNICDDCGSSSSRSNNDHKISKVVAVIDTNIGTPVVAGSAVAPCNHGFTLQAGARRDGREKVVTDVPVGVHLHRSCQSSRIISSIES